MSSPTFTVVFGVRAPDIIRVLKQEGFKTRLDEDYDFADTLINDYFDSTYNGNADGQWDSAWIGSELSMLDAYNSHYTTQEVFPAGRVAELTEDFIKRREEFLEFLAGLDEDSDTAIERIKEYQPAYYIVCGTD